MFRDAAAHQSRSLGFDPAIVWVPHPVQNRTGDELKALAESATDPVLAALTGGPHPVAHPPRSENASQP